MGHVAVFGRCLGFLSIFYSGAVSLLTLTIDGMALISMHHGSANTHSKFSVIGIVWKFGI